MKKLPIPKIIAFDFDQTLHDIIDIYNDLLNKVMDEFNHIELGKEAFEKFIKEYGYTTNYEVFKILFGEKAEDALASYYNHFHELSLPKNSILPGVKFLLERLKTVYKLPIVGVTNMEQHMAKKTLRDIGISPFFDSIAGLKIGRRAKPNTDLLILALAKIGAVPTKEVWFIGDSASDTLCAKKAGCTSIRFYYDEKPHDPNADAFCNSHYELERSIAELLGY